MDLMDGSDGRGAALFVPLIGTIQQTDLETDEAGEMEDE